LLRSEILFLFLFVFSICLTSFSIPLVLGGAQATNLEIHIYNTLRIDGDWSRAVLYTVLQMTSLFAVAWFIPKPIWSMSFNPSRWSLLGVKRLLPLVLLPSGVLLIGWIVGIVQSLRSLAWSNFVWSGAGPAMLNTLIVALGSGWLTLFLCLWISYVWPHRSLSLFMKGYLAPSSVVTGFAFLLLPVEGGNWPVIKMIVALTMVSFPILFRWIGQAALESAEEQILVARSLGASWGQIVFEVIWPQRGHEFLRMAGLSALWASGDFALSSIIAESNHTWALYIDDLIGNYRLELATVYTVPLFLIGLLCYGLFIGVSRYVAR
jgi:ABC-type Fe3+ transport system permease subunit